MKLASGFCIPEPLRIHVNPLCRQDITSPGEQGTGGYIRNLDVTFRLLLTKILSKIVYLHVMGPLTNFREP